MSEPRCEQLAEGVTLWLGDCRDLLSSIGHVDAIVTDPPYGLGDKMKGGTWGAKPEFIEMVRWDETTPTAVVLTQLINMSNCCIFWGGQYFSLPPSRCWLLWNKTNAVPTMADFETAWTNLDRPSKRFDAPVGRVEFGHPTQKPIELMRWTLGFIPRAKSILDPYMGSGTTGVACFDLGRKFIGIEREPKYFDIACRRISDALARPRLPFEETALPPSQQLLFPSVDPSP